MPTPPKTSRSGIVDAARDLISERGLDSLTMQAVADRVGVRGPSLYKHFADRAALLRAVERSVVADLETALCAVSAPNDHAALLGIAAAYRRFAAESPGKYALIFALHSGDPETEAARRRALAPALQRLESYFGDPQLAFLRARALTAFLHGFVSMESAGAFRFGGSVDEAFAHGLGVLLAK